MERIYKGYFPERLRKYITDKLLFIEDEEAFENTLFIVGGKKWNIQPGILFYGLNDKALTGALTQIMEYLGSYTHKVAITAHWILHTGEEQISFKYKDYQDGHKQKIMMTLSHGDFCEDLSGIFCQKVL